MAHSPHPRRIPLAYRHALILAAVICATVIGIFLVDPLVRSNATHGAEPVAFYAVNAAHAAPVAKGADLAAVTAEDAQVWAADDSAKGTRPDAAH